MDAGAAEWTDLLHRLARALEWQAELGALGVSRGAAGDPPVAAPTAEAGPPMAAPRPAPAAASRPSPPTPQPPPTRPAPPAQPSPTAAPAVPTPAVPSTPAPVSDPAAPAAALPEPPRDGAAAALALDEVRQRLGDCRRCGLCNGRKNIVWGVGSPTAQLMFIGEAPGADEDRQGEPFVGKAGQLLTKMIQAMGLQRDDVYIANIIKCRPPENRDPEPDEVDACEPFLKEQIAVIRPRVIVSLGRISAQTLLRVKTPITWLRGKWKTYDGIKLMPTFHPAYLLRNPAAKKEAWEDLQAVMAELGLSRPSRAPA